MPLEDEPLCMGVCETWFSRPLSAPGALSAIQSCGDLLGFTSPCPVVCTDGGFHGHSMFRVAPWCIPQDLENLLRHTLFTMLLSREKITEDLMMGWQHSGFTGECGRRIQPGEEQAMETLNALPHQSDFQVK
jgi:hypothetical protein